MTTNVLSTTGSGWRYRQGAESGTAIANPNLLSQSLKNKLVW